MTASPTPTDAGAGMPEELFAENAQNSAPGARVGLPSEETIARLVRDWEMTPGFDGWDAKVTALVASFSALIRPAFEAKERIEADARIFKINATSKLRSLEARALSAEAKLAQAVEDEREACAVIAETAPDYLMDSTFDGVARAIRARSAARGETR